MKKLIALLLALSMVVCFAACGGNENNNQKNDGQNAGNKEPAAEITGETYDAGKFELTDADVLAILESVANF